MKWKTRVEYQKLKENLDFVQTFFAEYFVSVWMYENHLGFSEMLETDFAVAQSWTLVLVTQERIGK